MSIEDNSSENQLNILFEYNPGLIFVHDLKGNVINMNKNLIKALGYKSKENILKLHVNDILYYEKKDFKLSKYLKLVLNKSKPTEYNFKPKKDSYIPVEGFGFPYKIRNLDVIVNISNFISDKKNLQIELLDTKSQLNELMVKMPEIHLWALSQKKSAIDILQKGGMVLKESEKKYKDILLNIKEGYFEVDLKGNLMFFNKSTCKILGYSPEELIGKNYRDFMEFEKEKLEEFINIDKIDGKAFEFELIKKNREKIYVESSISKKQNTEGKLIGFYGLIRDVTKRKEAENKINRKLQIKRVISKTSSLFINPSNYDDAINASLEFIGKLSKASRSYLFLFNDTNKTMDNTHEWCAKGVTAEKENLQGLPQDIFPWWMAKLNNEEAIHITDVSMMPEEAAAEQDILQQQDIKSLLVLPLFIGDMLSGFIGFDNVRETGDWDKENLFILQISSDIIGNTLRRKKIEEKLKNSEQNLINLNLELEERIKLRTKELRESEKRYRNLIETTPAIIQSVRLDGTFIFINQTWLDTFGYTREEVHSLNLVDVIHPESQQHCQNLFSRIMQGESIFDIEATFVAKDGKPIYVEGNANPYFTDDKVTATRGIFHNVTERKKAEQKVKESEERYHNLFESSPVMITLIDTKGKIIEVNPATLEGYGFKKEDFINKDFKEVYTIPPKYLPILAEKFKELFAKGVLEPMELQFYTKDRELIWVTLQASLVKIGSETYIQAIIQDINEQKKAEQKVKESEEKYRLITENINDAIYVLNEKFEFEYINASVHERLMGYSENDLIGRSSINFVHPEDVKKSMRALRNVTKGGMGKEGMEVIRLRDKKNIYHWFEIRGRTFIDRDNKLKALLVARDVTDRIIADQKLKKSEELYHKAYEQVNFYKDLFTHDISNILQMIKSTVELSSIYLNDPKKLNEIQEMWNLVNSQVNRGSRLVSNVRRLSQIEYTQVPIQSIEVFSYLHEAIEYTQKGIQEKKINFQIDSIFRTYNIKANELLLDVFENIIINSIRYSDNSVIEILIKISKLQKDGIKFLKMEFMDNGIGISDDRKKIIFQKGYIKEKQSKGMGIGLSLVKKIIESYNGQIWVEDKIKGDFTKGSNFIILIPEE